MSILRDIQATLLDEGADLASALLKLRFLALRLGGDQLEAWVKHEAEGYPHDIEVPAYRRVPLTYKGTWFGPGGSSVSNVPIPLALIAKYAGEKWVQHGVRESIASVQQFAKVSDGGLGIDASNLILRLQGKVYPGYSCASISGLISHVTMIDIIQTVRSRILEITFEMEKMVPGADQISVSSFNNNLPENKSAVVNQIFNQTIYGDYTNLNAGNNSNLQFTVVKGNKESLISYLVESGIPKHDAKEIASAIESDPPKSVEAPLNEGALSWLKANAPKAASGLWSIGSAALTTVVTEAALKYSGLK